MHAPPTFLPRRLVMSDQKSPPYCKSFLYRRPATEWSALPTLSPSSRDPDHGEEKDTTSAGETDKAV